MLQICTPYSRITTICFIYVAMYDERSKRKLSYEWMELRGISLIVHIHVSVSDLCIGLPIFCCRKIPSWEYVNSSQTECGNWD
jgi:hypothetical protein